MLRGNQTLRSVLSQVWGVGGAVWGQRLNWMALVGPFQLGVLCDSLQKGFPGSFHSHHPLQTSLCEATDLPSICCYADKPQRTPTKESCHSHRHTLIHLRNFRKYSSNAMIVLALLKQSGLQWAEVPTSSQSQRAEDKDFLNCLDSPKENKCFCSSQAALQ